MKSVFPFIHLKTSVWCLDGRKGQGGGVGLFMYVLMFNYRPQCLPPSHFFLSSPLRLSQTEPESDSCNKSLMEPGSNQHGSRMAWESMWASSSIDNTLSGYQTRAVPHNGISALTGSAGNGMTSPGGFGVLRGHQSGPRGHSDTKHMALTFSERCLPWHKVLYKLVAPSIHGTMLFIMAGVR